MSQRILIVDDDKNTCIALASILREEGFTVDMCHDAQRALALLGAASYDVLLTDFVMPGMNGLELVRAAKELQGSLRCVVMSGRRTRDNAPELVAWIDKPVDVDQLISQIKA